MRRTTVKPLLICGQERWKRIPHLKLWYKTRPEEVPLDLPYHNKTRKKTELTSKSDCLRMVKKNPRKAEIASSSEITTEPEPFYHAMRILIFA